MDIDQLSKVPVVLSPVTAVLSASKYVQPIDESPCAVNVLTATDIQRSGAKTIPDLLRRFPGVWSWTKSRSDQDIGLMGMIGDDSPMVLYLMDGQPISSPMFDGMQWPQFPVPLEDIERIEVVRGGGSAIYGANAYTGVINIITKPTKDRKSTVRAYSGEGGIDNGTFTFARTYDQLSLYVTGGYQQTHQKGVFDPVFNMGEVNYYQTPVLNAKMEYQISDEQKVTWLTTCSNGDGGYQASPGDESVDSVKAWKYFYNQGQYFNQLSEDTNFSLKGEFYDQHQQNFTPYRPGNPEKYKVYGQRFYAEADLLTRRLERHTLLVGSAFEYTMGNSIGEVSNLYPGRLHTFQMFGLFLEDDIRLSDKWSFIPALRFDYYDDADDEFNPRGTLMYRMDEKNTLRGSIGRSYRRPGLYGQYYNVEWPGGYFRGAPGLPAETALNYELEYRTRIIENYSLKMEVCQSRLAQIPANNITFPGPKITIAPTTHEYVINTFIWELEGVAIENVLKWYTNMTIYDGQDITSHVSMVDIPDSMFNIGFQYAPTEKLYFTMDGHYQGSFQAVDQSVTDPVIGLPPGTSVPQFLTVDAKVGYFLTKNAEIGLGVENLFNDRHVEYPLCPLRSRTLYAECRVTW